MTLFKNITLISFCTIVLAGCATQKNIVSLPDKIQREIGSTDVYLEECAKKMKADIESSNLSTYSGGGLLVALVDCAVMTHRENCADEALVDIQKEIQGFNFQEKFQDRLTQKLKNTNWLHVQRVNHITGINDEAHQEIFKKANTDCILTSKFIYKLNPQFNVLTGTLFLTLYPTSNKLKKIVNTENPLETPIFKLHIAATEKLAQPGEEIQENAKVWAQNNGSKLKQALENILNQVFVRLETMLRTPNHLPGE
ncbi:MAG: hypothetical protein K0R52_345 [Alphaproteobacteria bacterium]|nr:hypothetical protein [Alphaproteobacteria bacterium]